MIDKVRGFLVRYKKKTLELHTLQDEFQAIDYETIASAVQQLMTEGTLVGMKDWNQRNPSLPKKYRVIHSNMNSDFYERLKTLQLKRHPLISLDAYFKLGQDHFEDDLPLLVQVENYLGTRDLLADRREGVPVPEASFHMVGDEKWLDEEGGELLLKRWGLSYEQLGIVHVQEPLMFAVHYKISEQSTYKHLIVENKTPFHALLQGFQEQELYSTLIFGRGWTIQSNLSQLCGQTGLDPQRHHAFYYFGDLDHEGITIWHSLFQAHRVLPDVNLYRLLLDKKSVHGKEHQRPQQTAVEAFTTFFTEQESFDIRSMLEEGRYLPQEAVSSREWKAYWGDQR